MGQGLGERSLPVVWKTEPRIARIFTNRRLRSQDCQHAKDCMCFLFNAKSQVFLRRAPCTQEVFCFAIHFRKDADGAQPDRVKASAQIRHDCGKSLRQQSFSCVQSERICKSRVLAFKPTRCPKTQGVLRRRR